MAGCPWQRQFITPQHRSNRVPQGSPSYVGGHRSEVPLFLCCIYPNRPLLLGIPLVTRSYQQWLIFMATSDTSQMHSRSACTYCQYGIVKEHRGIKTPLLIRTSRDHFLSLEKKIFQNLFQILFSGLNAVINRLNRCVLRISDFL